ncbi:sensor histidine kinase [uncultured Tenacibaculum sp.]|uniref:sensor histidine kinase n=1 Tax=uncultured Tenacibaculum sp. TaxID=174713 RepID=UPI002614EC38|nr:sensor histidine kinase [uncultured Tenacibaculum sp.]
MSKSIKSLLISVFVSFLIVLSIQQIFSEAILEIEGIRDLFILFPFITTSIFIGIYFSHKYKNFIKSLFGVTIGSFLFHLLLLFLITKIYNLKSDSLYKILFLSAIITSFITLITFLITSFKREESGPLNTQNLIISYFTLTIIYEFSILIWVNKFNNYSIIYNTLIIGCFILLGALYFFDSVDKKIKVFRIKGFLIPFLYFISLIILPLIGVDFSVFKYIILTKETIVGLILIKGIYYAAIVLIVHLNYIFKKSKNEKEKLEQQSLQSQLNYQQLKSQLSPHFLFNNINVLTSLIEENPKKATLFSTKLSDIYRYFLEHEKSDVVKVGEELEFIYNYLDLLTIRFEEGLNYQIDLSADVKELYIISTAMQQVLENIVKHNEVSKSFPVQIYINNKENYLVIENNKNNKISKERSHKRGIVNIKQRYSYFTDNEVIIENSGNKFIIKLPLLTE